MKKDIGRFIYSIRLPLMLVFFLWIVEFAEWSSGVNLYIFGIFPREWSGLPSIFTAPFVHGDWSHLASNTLPLLILTSILVLFYPKVATQSFISILIGAGILVWLFARPSYHIGASGIVYGLVAFVFWTGVFKKNVKSIVLSLIVLTLYAGSVESMFPGAEQRVSWESHLFGAITGLITAFVFKNVVEEDEKEFHVNPWAAQSHSREYFLPRDVFEKTKTERYYEYLEVQRAKAEYERWLREQNNQPG